MEIIDDKRPGPRVGGHMGNHRRLFGSQDHPLLGCPTRRGVTTTIRSTEVPGPDGALDTLEVLF